MTIHRTPACILGPAAAVAVALGAFGCAGSEGPADGHKAREELVSLVEEAEAELEVTREQIETTLARYNLVMSQEGADPVAAYEDFAISLNKSHQRVAALDSFLSEMEGSSSDYFERWERDFDDYTSEDLKRRSQERLHMCRKRYGNIRTALAPAKARTDQFLANLNDQMLFLKYDLSPAAVRFLQRDAVILNNSGRQLVASLGDAIQASGRFVDGMSVLPPSVADEVAPDDAGSQAGSSSKKGKGQPRADDTAGPGGR